MKVNFLKYLVLILAFASLAIYLFVSAPAPLNMDKKQQKVYSIEEALTAVSELNDGARTFYTKYIVGAGLSSGLKFDEKWHKNYIDAGPLPALFLRGISTSIEKSEVPLGLYLGSDFPIVKENLFNGEQAHQFKKMRIDKKPKFFYDKDTERNFAMFPDFAVARACVTCHNEHQKSPKKNWRLNDLMGATTWSYPEDSVSTKEFIDIIKAYKDGANETYKSYLSEIESFKIERKPFIGGWPSNGYTVPTSEMFSDTLDILTSTNLLNKVLKSNNEK